MSGNAGKRILRHTAVIGVCTSMSRLLGLVRMNLMARFFGTSLFASAFFLAFKIPNMFRRLFGEGALSAAFVPVFTESLEKEGIEEANRLAAKVMTMLGITLASIVAGILLVMFAASDMFDLSDRWVLAIELSIIMLPYMFFICMVALFMGMLNSRHHFLVPAATPMLLNIVWIGSLLFLCPKFTPDQHRQVAILAWGILGAGVLQLLVQLPVLLKYGVRLKLSFAWNDERVKKILLLMGPGALGAGIFQINMLLGPIFAYWIAEWAVAAIQYAELMVYFPLGIIATSLGTVLLPTFSRHVAREERSQMLHAFNVSLRGLMFIMVPAAVGLGVLAKPVIALAYQYKAFDEVSAVRCARALWFFAPGLIVFSLYKVLVPAFYSLKDTKTPAVVSMFGIAVNLLFTILFIWTWPDGWKHAGIAFASVLSSLFSCIVLGVLIHMRMGNPGWGTIFGTVMKSLLFSAIMGVAVFFVHGWISSEIVGKVGVVTGRIVVLSVSIVAGLAVYGVLSLFACRSEIQAIRERS